MMYEYAQREGAREKFLFCRKMPKMRYMLKTVKNAKKHRKCHFKPNEKKKVECVRMRGRAFFRSLLECTGKIQNVTSQCTIMLSYTNFQHISNISLLRIIQSLYQNSLSKDYFDKSPKNFRNTKQKTSSREISNSFLYQNTLAELLESPRICNEILPT